MSNKLHQSESILIWRAVKTTQCWLHCGWFLWFCQGVVDCKCTWTTRN